MKQSERRAATIGQILDAAEHTVREDGLGALSVDRVVRAAGVSKGAFFHHFPTRGAMLDALLNRLASHFEADLARRTGSGDPFAVAWIEATCREVERDRLFLATLVAAVAADPALAMIVRERTDQWTERMIADGVPADRANLVRTTLDGLIMRCLIAPDITDTAGIRDLLLAVVAGGTSTRTEASLNVSV